MSGQNVNSWSVGDPGHEPVVVPWTVDCVPVVPVYRSRTLICYVVQCSSPAGEGAHTCLHLLCRIGTTPSISRLVDFSPVISLFLQSICLELRFSDSSITSFLFNG